jgi:hypothetical protein
MKKNCRVKLELTALHFLKQRVAPKKGDRLQRNPTNNSTDVPPKTQGYHQCTPTILAYHTLEYAIQSPPVVGYRHWILVLWSGKEMCLRTLSKTM